MDVSLNWLAALAQWISAPQTGNVLGLFGIALTIYYSRNANKSAVAAKLAAEEASRHFTQMNLLQEFTDLRRLVDDLLVSLEQKSWDKIEERGETIRLGVVAILAREDHGISDDLRGRLLDLVNEVKSLADTARNVRNGRKEPSIPRLTKIVSNHRETLMLSVLEARAKVGQYNAKSR